MVKSGQMILVPGSIVDLNAGLKATVWTTILDVRGQGHLLSIGIFDVDNLEQNESVRITIDERIILTGAADMPNVWRFIQLWWSIIIQALVVHGLADDESRSGHIAIPYRRSLKIEYMRGVAAGTTGLAINILYDITDTSLETIT